MTVKNLTKTDNCAKCGEKVNRHYRFGNHDEEFIIIQEENEHIDMKKAFDEIKAKNPSKEYDQLCSNFHTFCHHVTDNVHNILEKHNITYYCP